MGVSVLVHLKNLTSPSLCSCEASVEFGFPVLLLSLGLSPSADPCESQRAYNVPSSCSNIPLKAFCFPHRTPDYNILGESVLETLLLRAPCFVSFVVVVNWQLYGFLDELGYRPVNTQAKTFTVSEACRDPQRSAACFFTSFLFSVHI